MSCDVNERQHIHTNYVWQARVRTVTGSIFCNPLSNFPIRCVVCVALFHTHTLIGFYWKCFSTSAIKCSTQYEHWVEIYSKSFENSITESDCSHRNRSLVLENIDPFSTKEEGENWDDYFRTSFIASNKYKRAYWMKQLN